MTSRHKRPPQCQICKEQTPKYTCAQCLIAYCSVNCYKNHKETTCNSQCTTSKPVDDTSKNVSEEEPLATSLIPLRPLTSLKWPYVPDESAFPDPLKKNDPKALRLSQYEAIATSPTIREILFTHKSLPELLTSIDKLRGSERDEALQRALGVTAPEIDDQLHPPKLSDDVLALRELAEAIEAAVRGGDESALGLNWGE
ncbi:hypothetical protein BYT27DRAFT_7230873 [Phlegmacium glaucopus]|nr:hypothetical protein BYT27DRAFT_7230873 [Phlegmacium glaucopus]